MIKVMRLVDVAHSSDCTVYTVELRINAPYLLAAGL